MYIYNRKLNLHWNNVDFLGTIIDIGSQTLPAAYNL